MKLLKHLCFCLLLHFTGSTSAGDTNEDAKLSRILRDITGQYHPELYGDHVYRNAHAHTHSHEGDSTSGVFDVAHIHSTTGDDGFNSESRIGGPGKGYYLPPPPPPSPPPSGTPNGYANCGCVVKDQCAKELVAGMDRLLKELKNDVRCGKAYQLCCYDDPWPGPKDEYKHMAPCVAAEYCVRSYGSDPYDVQNFGVIGPCLGLGSVRCLDQKPPGPTPIVVPIYDIPPPPPPTPVLPPPTLPPTTTQRPVVIYEPPPPPVIYEPPPPPPVIYEPPPAQPSTVYEHPVVYEPPPTQPVAVYTPPQTYNPPTETYEPPTVPVDTYEPPTPVETYVPPTPVETYVPPTPVETYVPPTPVETYAPPTPVETYVPPTPVETYVPPIPVDTYEPPTPVDTYEPPTPVDTYEPPLETYEPLVPGTSYGVPAVGNGVGNTGYARSPYYGGRYGHGRGYYSRYGGYPYGGGLGYGFRKRFRFSKGFYG